MWERDPNLLQKENIKNNNLYNRAEEDGSCKGMGNQKRKTKIRTEWACMYVGVED